MTSSLDVHLVPILEDNYAYLICSSSSNHCILVDPGDAPPILSYLDQHSLKLDQIWITHWHSDHIKGLKGILQEHPCEVLGPEKEADRIPALTQKVADLDILEWSGHKVKVFAVPGHTLGHVAYWFFDDHLLFSGDSLFSLGCGYLFEGTPEQMWNSLRKLRDLPAETQIYCGHEYTEKNAEFARSIDPENKELMAYQKEVKEKRSQGKPSLPALMGTELLTNPFLRADLPYWKSLLNLPHASPVDIFAALREAKNNAK